MTTSNNHPHLMTPYASVIIPAYNAAETLPACLCALHNQTVSAESYDIIVVDDGSTDDTHTIAQRMGARVVRLPVNQGWSVARNAGAAVSSAEILLFTDADCEPFPDWIAHMTAPFQRDPEVVGVKGAYRSRQTNLIARFTQLELEDKYDEMRRQQQIAFIDTYSAAYRRDLFNAHGGFDRRLSHDPVEDQDFSFKLAAQGYKLLFVPDALVYHHHLTSFRGYYRRKFGIGRSKVTILHRYPERIHSDSRTPLSLKIQFGLALLLTPILPLALFWRPARLFVIALLGIFEVSTYPFLIKSIGRDFPATVIAPPLLLLRAFALAHGYITGYLVDKRTHENRSTYDTTPQTQPDFLQQDLTP
ncbi:MAG: glycosyltransferase [Anaerolineae bacterium]|nr:glycosyltransferase [Anaerolineae bacterium]